MLYLKIARQQIRVKWLGDSIKPIFLLTIFFLIQVNTHADIIKMRGNLAGDHRSSYINTLLTEICRITKKSHGPCTIDNSVVIESRKRAKKYLLDGELHIAAEATRNDWEKDLLFVPFPLLKGLLGFAVFLIHTDNQNKLKEIKDLGVLKKEFTLGLGAQWSVTPALKKLGFHVTTSITYNGLFKMLEAKRFDLFPRSVSEVFGEYQSKKPLYKSLIIEEFQALYYPLPKFFFISPKFPKLHKRITYGLKKMKNNGSFDKLFYKNHHFLKKLDFNSRNIFVIKSNPLLSDIANKAFNKHRLTIKEIRAFINSR